MARKRERAKLMIFTDHEGVLLFREGAPRNAVSVDWGPEAARVIRALAAGPLPEDEPEDEPAATWPA